MWQRGRGANFTPKSCNVIYGRGVLLTDKQIVMKILSPAKSGGGNKVSNQCTRSDTKWIKKKLMSYEQFPITHSWVMEYNLRRLQIWKTNCSKSSHMARSLSNKSLRKQLLNRDENFLLVSSFLRDQKCTENVKLAAHKYLDFTKNSPFVAKNITVSCHSANWTALKFIISECNTISLTAR